MCYWRSVLRVVDVVLQTIYQSYRSYHGLFYMLLTICVDGSWRSISHIVVVRGNRNIHRSTTRLLQINSKRFSYKSTEEIPEWWNRPLFVPDEGYFSNALCVLNLTTWTKDGLIVVVNFIVHCFNWKSI